MRRLWCGELESQRAKPAADEKTMMRNPTPAVTPRKDWPSRGHMGTGEFATMQKTTALKD